MILAGIDIGTNTLRLLIAETVRGSLREISADRRITRLGQGLDRSGMIDDAAAERSVNVLREFADAIRRHGVRHTSAIGTSALRNASNARQFLSTVKEHAGIDVRVVSGEEEARLTLLGVKHSLKAATRGPAHGASCILDVGGGSTEVIVSCGEEAPVIFSLPLGAVYLTERFLAHDPPSGDELDRMRALVGNELDSRFRELRGTPPGLFIGTAGTIATLASINLGLETFDPDRINGSTLTRDDIDDRILALSRLTRKERMTVRGLEPGREDIIIAGAVITREVMSRLHRLSMLVSVWGLREGIVLDLSERLEKSV